MLEFLREKLTTILRREHWWAEFWSAVVAMIWAILSMMQPNGAESMSYYLLFASAPKAVMEAVGMSVFILQLAGLIGTSTALRWCAAALASWFYGLIFLSFYSAGVSIPTAAPWLGYIGINTFVLFRLPYGLR